MAAADTARLLASLDLNDSKFQAGIRRSLGGLGKLDKGMAGVGRNMGKVGKGFGKAAALVGGAAVTGLVLAGKAAIDYQEAFQGVVKTVTASDAEFDQISDALRRMSTEMPTSAIELARIAEAGGAMGVKAKDIEAFTKQVAILAATTDDVSADEAATALGQLQNVIGLTGAEFDNFSASLVALGNNGASTEGQILEIARRSGGAAKLFGIAKDQILGWSAAAANLGINSELAGTSLQNVFIKLLPKISKGSMDVNKVFGLTGKQVKKLFAKDASGALAVFVGKLAKLPKDARLDKIQDIFGKGSGITRLLLGLTGDVDGVTDSLKLNRTAWFESTAAQEEFDKRNATVRSALTRLKNGIIDAGVSIGEGFTPAIGRAADKLSTFLKDPGNRKALEDIGKDIGKGIDSIDWDKLLGVAKSLGSAFAPALSVITKIVDLIAKLPPEVIGVGGAAIVTDKLSGGAISSGLGGIFAGLGSSIAKAIAVNIPILGKAFVQPVLVTNFPPGGFGVPGGGAGAAGATGLLSFLGIAGIGAVGGALTAEVTKSLTYAISDAFGLGQGGRDAADQSRRQAFGPFEYLRDIPGYIGKTQVAFDNLTTFLNSPHPDFLGDLTHLLLRPEDKPDAGGRTNNKFMNATKYDQPPVPDYLQTGAGQLLSRNIQHMKERIEHLDAAGKGGKANEVRDRLETANQRLQTLRDSMASAITDNTTKTGAGLTTLTTETRTGLAGTNTNVRGTTGAVQTAQGAITGAIAANRPIVTTLVDVSVTSSGVEKAVTTSTRYGDQNGSAGGGGSHDGHGWGGQ